MECPNCEAPMTHLGYFTWVCETCGHRCAGDLPAPVARRPAEEETVGQ
jgi:ribosomal protein L37AE/L43A